MKETTEKKCNSKAMTIVYLIFGLLAVVFAILDLAEVWEYAHIAWSFSFVPMCLIDSARNWQEKRKIAITELVIAVFMLALSIAGFFIK